MIRRRFQDWPKYSSGLGGASDDGPSPAGFTKPPNGMAQIEKRVPDAPVTPSSSGPKPNANFSTRTPRRRQAMKWPDSWRKMTRPSATALAAIVKTDDERVW